MQPEGMFLKAAPHMYVLSGGMYSILTFASMFTDIRNMRKSPNVFVNKIMKTMLYIYSVLPVSMKESTLTTVGFYFSG